jgi:hypothetical protein
MDCRTFHRKLEDYLEDGLDFPARFGMERHAKQCFACEKEVQAALRLRQMARELRRVGAPADFEGSLMIRIQNEKPQRRFWRFEELWLYSFEGFSWRVAGVTALVTFLMVGSIFYVYLGAGRGRSAATQAAVGSLTNPTADRGVNAKLEAAGLSNPSAALSAVSALDVARASRFGVDNWATPYAEPGDSDLVDILVPFASDRQLIMQLPKTIRMRYAQPSREFYIRNVSH